MMKILVISATAMALAAPVLAQAPQSPPATAPKAEKLAEIFVTADADKSGSLSIAEVKMQDATVTQADFDKADADKSKSLSKVEFETWAAVKKGAKASAPGE
jgi:hypothetical protein